jgi:hypothetical protein
MEAGRRLWRSDRGPDECPVSEDATCEGASKLLPLVFNPGFEFAEGFTHPRPPKPDEDLVG